MVGFHDRVHDCSNTFEEVLRKFRCGAREGLDEYLKRLRGWDNGVGRAKAYDTGVWLLVASVETLDADGHVGRFLRRKIVDV